MMCSICTKPIEHKLQLTYDHVIPLARGGPHTEGNLRPAHWTCNAWKNDRLPEELVGLTPPELGAVSDAEVYHVAKINKAKSETHKSKHSSMTPEEAAAWQAKRQAGLTPESISARTAKVRAAWAAKTPEEKERYRQECRARKKGSPGNLENLKKGWAPEVRAKAVEAAAELRRGQAMPEEQREAISEGVKLAYEEGRHVRGHTEETKLKISETKRIQNASN